LSAPFAGPHFFTSFTFFDEIEEGEPFEAASVFVPRWQVSCRDGRTVAVANLLIETDSPLDAVVEKIWRARQKFGAFDYGAPEFAASSLARNAVAIHEVGDEDHYARTVSEALRRIATGEFRKIVLARAKDLRAGKPFHPLQVLNGLRQRYADCFAFSVANGRGQSLIGASPERLLRVHDGALLTEALAGSAPRGASASEDAAFAGGLMRNEKDLAEHACVLDSILRRLNPLGLQPRHPDKPAIRRLANVQHLHTPVVASVAPGVRLLDVLARLHPTPAVGGSPREAAVACIRKMESFPRGVYAGALGWINASGEGEFFVGLRSALVDGPAARLYAGAGIMAGSDPAKEKAETELKFAAMQASLLDT
jgi:menaquinone-specific isochorismate synthase